MKKSPFKFNFLLLALGIIIFGQAIRICEAPLNRITDDMDEYNFANSMWLVILTMTTVGYGDIYPRTDIGRGSMFLCALFGVIIVSIMVVSIMNELEMSPLEEKSYSLITKIDHKSDMRRSAASVITRSTRIYLKLRKGDPVSTKYLFKLRDKIASFRSSRRSYQSTSSTSESQNNELYREFNKIRNSH